LNKVLLTYLPLLSPRCLLYISLYFNQASSVVRSCRRFASTAFTLAALALALALAAEMRVFCCPLASPLPPNPGSSSTPVIGSSDFGNWRFVLVVLALAPLAWSFA
jgi:hypothetical protein